MKKTIFILATVGAALSAGPAFARDDDQPFTGPRVGAEAGWGRVDSRDLGSDGFIYGATAGYDLAIDKVRVGPEVAVTGSTQKKCMTLPAGGPAQRECQRTDRDFFVGGRLGYVIDPHVLLYGKVGYTNGRFTDRLEAANHTELSREGRDRNGVRIGGGLEYALTPHFYVSSEYRYSHYEHREHQNQVVGGVGYRF